MHKLLLLGILFCGFTDIVDVKIKDVISITKVTGRNIMSGIVIFDQQIPNGRARLFVKITEDKKAVLTLYLMPNMKLGEQTDRLEVKWNPDAVNVEKMAGESGRLFLK